jgi:hypothetical protein
MKNNTEDEKIIGMYTKYLEEKFFKKVPDLITCVTIFATVLPSLFLKVIHSPILILATLLQSTYSTLK